MRRKRAKCDRCQLVRINGTVCHETGCPNSNIDPFTGRPAKAECKFCGNDFYPKERAQLVCKSCIREYYG